MIYTVTFNPALDYVIAVDHFAPGQINRTKEETMVCGGKGINVSALLANLGYESTALGFVAGFTGEEIVRRCQKAGFHSDFIRVKDGLSRINVKMKSDEETEINGMGPDITGKNVELLFEQLNELKAGDVLVLSGSTVQYPQQYLQGDHGTSSGPRHSDCGRCGESASDGGTSASSVSDQTE